ncbi:hypothetical protein ACPPVU_20130 [Mucilaginibacter sp. McL0603]|uniref:hypothetical protein n=1 Tax=Mucilaginibacter sp. McL0603 TaxID=3415670 RepID=UPI003CF9B3A3
MKSKFLPLPLALLLFCQTGYSQWYKKQFVIGSFADPRIFGVNREISPAKDSISFSLAKAAHINLLSGPQFYNGAQDFSLMDKTLGLASKYNMHVMVVDSKLQVTSDKFSGDDAQKVLAHFKTLDATKREALGGYSFGGEFPLAKSSVVRKWAGFYNNGDSDRPGYTYLLPSYGFSSRSAYEEYLDSYLNEKDPNATLQIVAYDYYPFLSPTLMASYFYNLGIIKEKAGNRPFWYYIQSTVKKSLPDINNYQLKFMAFCPLAYGAKGALYYTYESLPAKYNLNYYDAIIDPAGKPTAKYYQIMPINYYLTNIAGPIIMKNACVGTYHVSKSPTNEDIPDKDILSKRNEYVVGISNANILVGIFKNQQANGYFLMLINKSSNDISRLKVAVPGSKSVTEFPPSENYHGQKDKTKLSTDNGGGRTNFSINRLPAGAMTIVEVD